MKEIILIGNGGHSKVIKDIIVAQNEYKLVGYLDNKFNGYTEEKGLFYDIIDNFEQYIHKYYFCIAIGNNAVREKIAKQFDLNDSSYPSLIHPSAILGTGVRIGCGTVVMPNATINADSEVGKHGIINTGAIVEHDNRISDFVHISPNAVLAGGVSVGKSTHIAIGAVVLPSINVGSKSIVGAGATVVKDVENEVIVIGTPAKIKE